VHEACETKNCSYNALQVETPTSTKQHFEACAHHLHISLQGQSDMFSSTNQKNILNVSLFYFHDVTPHSQPLTPQNKKKTQPKFSWTVHKKFKPIVHEKKV